jgi:hypothetical protein
MKKAVRTKGTSNVAPRQAVPAGAVNTVSTAKAEVRPQLSASPTPVWSRYVDSRLKQFCMR